MSGRSNPFKDTLALLLTFVVAVAVLSLLASCEAQTSGEAAKVEEIFDIRVATLEQDSKNQLVINEEAWRRMNILLSKLQRLEDSVEVVRPGTVDIENVLMGLDKRMRKMEDFVAHFRYPLPLVGGTGTRGSIGVREQTREIRTEKIQPTK